MLHLELEPVGIFFGNTAAKCDLEASPDKRNCVVPFLLSAADALPAERTMSESVTSHSRTFASQSSPEYFLKLLIRSGSAIFISSVCSDISYASSELCKYLCGVCIGLYLGHHLFDVTLLIYDECGADYAHAHLAVQLLFLPYSVCLYSFKLRIG